MGLFDKKYCDNCGASLGLIIDCKLSDANICKECRNKLSPFFSGYKQTTLAEVKQQLAYREQNKAKLASFRPTLTIGDTTKANAYKVIVDQNAGAFIVTRSSNYANENPDIIPVSSVTAVNVKVDEDRDEIKQTNADGQSVSYNPPRYEYEYIFRVEILVNHQYFSKIDYEMTDYGRRPDSPYSEMYRFFENQANQLCLALTGRNWVSGNTGYVNNGFQNNQGFNQGYGQQTAAGFAGAVFNGVYNAQQNMAQQQNGFNNGYQQQNGFNTGYQQAPQQNGFNGAVNNGYQPVQNTPVNNAAASWVCSCGQQNTGKFCMSCGSKMPCGCPSCGWQPTAGQAAPRFCPNCGNQLG